MFFADSFVCFFGFSPGRGLTAFFFGFFTIAIVSSNRLKKPIILFFIFFPHRDSRHE